jgi:hypothetical protein
VPTLLEEFVIKIGLDPSDFRAEIAATEKDYDRLGKTAETTEAQLSAYWKKAAADAKQAAKDTKQAADDTAAQAQARSKSIQQALQPAQQAITGLRNEFLAFFGIFSLSTAGIERFFTNIMTGTMQLGRQAQMLDTTAQSLGTYQGMLRGVGGTAEDAAQSIGAITEGIAEWKNFGQPTAQLGMISQFLGQSFGQIAGADPADVIEQIYQRMAANGMDPASRRAMFRRMGMAESNVAESELPPEERARRKAEYAKIQPSPDDVKAFSNMNFELGLMHDRVSFLAEKVAVALVPELKKVVQAVSDWVDANKDWLRDNLVQDIRAFVTAIVGIAETVNNIVQAIGGWQVAVELLTGAWLVFKGIQVASMIIGIIGTITGMNVALGISLVSIGALVAPFLAIAAAVAAIGAGLYLAATSPNSTSAANKRAVDAGLTEHSTLTDPWETTKRMFQGKPGVWFTDPQGNEVSQDEVMRRYGGDQGAATGGGGTGNITSTNRQLQDQGPSQYDAQIAAAAAAHGLDAATYRRQLQAESGLSNLSANSAGAAGVAQFIPSTAAEYGVNAMDPASSIEGGARYMANLKNQFGGNTALALMAYNWGPGAVQNWIKGGRRGPVPEETRNYVARIMGPGGLAMANAGRAGGAGGADATGTVAALQRAQQPPAAALPAAAQTQAAVGAGIAATRAAGATHTAHNDNTTTVTVGSVTIQTRATDADGIAKDIAAKLRKYAYVTQANYGLT